MNAFQNCESRRLMPPPADDQRILAKSFASLFAFLVLVNGTGLTADESVRPERDAAVVAAQARLRGDARRGAWLFHKSSAACVKCHADGNDSISLGPNLTTIDQEATDQSIVESILDPSKSIRKGFETVTVLTVDGQVVSGLIAEETGDKLVLKQMANPGHPTLIPKKEIEEVAVVKKSMMPEGLVDTLSSDRDLFDLARYVLEVARGSSARAEALRPTPAELLVVDDTADLDHAGILRSLGERDLRSGKEIFLSQCKGCHGPDGNTPTLPTARAFGKEPMKYGADPYKMLLTLTRGAGLMPPMQQLSPKERYQVIHYIRESFMKPSNRDYREADEAYLTSLPKGSSDGKDVVSKVQRDFGPVLGSQIGSQVNNALTFRFANDVTVAYDLHRMRLVGAWTGGFLDLSQTHHYRQRGEQMPKIEGRLIDGLSEWQWAFDGSFEIPAEAKPPRGPIRSDWLQYYGHYLHADRAVLSYGIHGRKILETVHTSHTHGRLLLHHTLRLESGSQPLKLSVAKLEGSNGPSGLIAPGTGKVSGRSGSASDHLAVVSRQLGDKKPPDDKASKANQPLHVAVAVRGDTDGTTWEVDDAGRIVLSIPPSREPRILSVVRASTTEQSLDALCDTLRTATQDAVIDPLTMTRGDRIRWPQLLEVKGRLGEPINGYALDTIAIPFENPWNAWMRTSAVDFFDDGRAVVTTHGGDVYIVSGIDSRLERVTWKRFVAGLFEPFGVRVAQGVIYVTCRDGIKRLHDFNADGEADFVEAFWIDDDVSSSFHAYNFDLQTDTSGNFYFAKAGQYSQHHRPGTIMRVSAEGGQADVVAWGLRTPNGMGKLVDDRFTVSDNQGPWMPAGKISLVRPDSFLGNMPINDEQTRWLKQKHGGDLPETFDEPIIWMPQELDNSCGGQAWVDDKRFGPLSGRLLHSSFGKGWLYYLSLQETRGSMQASIVSLPHQWDAGVMRLRANPVDGQLYGTGMSGWQGPAQGKDGCFQRLRYAGEPIQMIDDVRVVAGGLQLRFTFTVDAALAREPKSWRCEMWDYLWSKQYGSDQYSVLRRGEKGRDTLAVQAVQLIDDRTLRLEIPDLQVCDQLTLEMNIADADGRRFIEQVYLTVHEIPEETPQGK